MCWLNVIAIPIVLKKPLKVYKVGTVTPLGNFISLYQTFWYYKHKILPTIKLNPVFKRHLIFEETWMRDNFYIYEGYHSYLTEKRARCRKRKYDDIGIFEIPTGATIYVNYEYKEVVSTDIRYLGLLK